MYASVLAVVLIGASVVMSSVEVEEPKLAALQALCEQKPELKLCSLDQTIDEALVEIDHLIAGGSADGETMEKRKSAFVRFGKRKSAFVRFGKRKSSYVRFG